MNGTRAGYSDIGDRKLSELQLLAVPADSNCLSITNTTTTTDTCMIGKRPSYQQVLYSVLYNLYSWLQD